MKDVCEIVIGDQPVALSSWLLASNGDTVFYQHITRIAATEGLQIGRFLSPRWLLQTLFKETVETL